MMSKLLKCLMAVLLVFMLGGKVAFAEVFTCEGLGEYYMESESESLSDAKEAAKLLAEADVIEQIKVIVTSDSRMSASKLTSDEVTAAAAGLMHLKDVKYKVAVEPDGIMLVKATLLAEIDTEELAEEIQESISK